MLALDNAATAAQKKEDRPRQLGEWRSTEEPNPMEGKPFFSEGSRAMRAATQERLRRGAHPEDE